MNENRWGLIILLACIALIRPIMSILGLTERIGQPWTSLTVTVIITAIWIAAVIRLQVRQPVRTLVFTGIGYGILAIIISAVLSPILTGQLQGPATNPLAIVSVLATNALWGLVAGVIAAGLQRKSAAGAQR